MNRLPWWEQGALSISVLFLVGGLAWLLADGPVTGMFARDVQVHLVEKQVVSPEMLTLQTSGPLRSVRLWGTLQGRADVWLVNQRDERLKVFTTTPSGMQSITGMGVADTAIVLEGVCRETCLIPNSFATKEYRVVMQVADESVLNVQRFEVES